MKISIIGLGYIGLPTAALLANRGHQILGVDINADAVDKINHGQIHILEPDLDTFVSSAVKSGNLVAYTTPQAADVYMICVPTPFHKINGHPMPDLNFVLEAVESIAPLLKPNNILILESTSPVGTTEAIKAKLNHLGVDTESIYLAYCPERVLPGKIMVELLENDRIVGGVNLKSSEKVKEFYESFISGRVFLTDSKSAEACKLIENAYRDVNIAFANEVSMLCKTWDIDVWNLISMANQHPRVNILQPGVGVGGHCIAVDPWFIISQQAELSQMMQMARKVNLQKTQWVLDTIVSEAEKFAQKYQFAPRIACLGLSFKPNIDDIRESPALDIAKALKSHNFQLLIVEPHIESHPDFSLFSLQEAIEIADIIVILVNHRLFQQIKLPSGKILLNFCNPSHLT